MYINGLRSIELNKEDEGLVTREEDGWRVMARCVPEIHGLLPLHRWVDRRQKGTQAERHPANYISDTKGHLIVAKCSEDHSFRLLDRFWWTITRSKELLVETSHNIKSRHLHETHHWTSFP